MIPSQSGNESSAHPARIGLLGASLATSNLGVNALAVGAVRTLLHRHAESKVFLLDYGEAPSEHTLRIDGRQVSIPLVNLRFSKKLYLPNNIGRLLLEMLLLKLIPSQRLRGRLAAKNPWLRRVWETDLFGSLAAGDSFSDIYGLPRLLYVALPQILVLLAGKRLIMLPQTIGPFHRQVSKAIAKYILTRAERVYSRDYRGLITARELIGRNLPDGRIALCQDLGFVLEPDAPAQLAIEGFTDTHSGEHPLVGLNLSGLLAMGGYTKTNMFALKVDYRELVTRLIDFLIHEKRANVLLIPHVFGTGPHAESDAAVCKTFYEQLHSRYPGRIGLVRGIYNEREIKHVIGRCDFFIGSRMHACIAALSQNVPALAIAYSDKFIGVMETIGLESLVADPRHMYEKEIINRVAELYDQRNDIRKELERRIPRIQERVLTLFEEISGTGPKDGAAISKPAEASAVR
jgi:colanic acid/amylovoran biosynthesis protein